MGVSSIPSPPVLSDFFVRNGERISDLAHEFSGYVVNITETRIRNWIKQFAPEHQELALKLLENVDYYSHDRTIQELSTLGNMIRQARENQSLGHGLEFKVIQMIPTNFILRLLWQRMQVLLLLKGALP